MKARKAGMCHECWDEIEKGEDVVYRDVMGTGERSMIHATHVNLPPRHVVGTRRWGGIQGSDPTQPGRGPGRKTNKMPVVATLNRERFYLGRAYTKGQKDEMLRKFYDEHCDDRFTCTHAVHVEARGGALSPAQRQAERTARIKAGMPNSQAS